MPQDISEETILNEFSSAVKIVSVRRLFRKVRKDGKDELIPTQSVLAKFQDQNLPRALTFMHWQSKHVKLENCHRHILPSKCCNCGQDHFPSSNKCLRQRQVY
ncbi:hypothetical protein ALC56_14098 [Trachymyrmex septentrionalis]|uniref:Uncharacterized protein n=1 Tax=Trachymyrmex septentrionalis TaxID=34720 RepID=A0A195ETM1_9HYME|nr:hypothetical protein ALC56_14098 [Trachymyrmex septentrionalis]